MYLKKWSIVENLLPQKKSFFIYNMSNNSLIETGNSERGLAWRVFLLLFCTLCFFYDFFFIFYFLPKKCSLKIVFPRFKVYKKNTIYNLAEHLENTLERVFFSNVAGLLAAIWATDKLLFVNFWGAPILRNSSKKMPLAVVAIAILLL